MTNIQPQAVPQDSVYDQFDQRVNGNSSFNPNDYMMDLKGKAYLPVNARIAWAQAELPKRWSSEITKSELLTWTEEDPRTKGKMRTVREYSVRVRVTFPNGITYEDEGSETNIDFGDFREKAITKALGRALAQAGYGTLFAPEFDESATLDRKSGIDGVRVVDSPLNMEDKPAPKSKKMKLLPPEVDEKIQESAEPIQPAPQTEPAPQAPQAPQEKEKEPVDDNYSKMDTLSLATALRNMVNRLDSEDYPKAIQDQVNRTIATANQVHKVEKASLLPQEALVELVRTVESLLKSGKPQ